MTAADDARRDRWWVVAATVVYGALAVSGVVAEWCELLVISDHGPSSRIGSSMWALASCHPFVACDAPGTLDAPARLAVLAMWCTAITSACVATSVVLMARGRRTPRYVRSVVVLGLAVMFGAVAITMGMTGAHSDHGPRASLSVGPATLLFAQLAALLVTTVFVERSPYPSSPPAARVV